MLDKAEDRLGYSNDHSALIKWLETLTPPAAGAASILNGQRARPRRPSPSPCETLTQAYQHCLAARALATASVAAVTLAISSSPLESLMQLIV